MPSLRRRIEISCLIAAASGSFCFLLLHRLQWPGDFQWAIYLAEKWLARQNPYDTPLEQYPFVAAIFGLPFVHMSREVAAAIFYGISSGLLAFGVTREGYDRLLIFLAYPYWMGLLWVQWPTIIAAGAFFPLLMPVAMAKPQMGLPVFLTRFSMQGLWACLAVGVVSLIMLPRWPMLWMGQFGHYPHFVPLLIFPGLLLLLALLRYRDRDAILLLLTAALPQRWFFDAFTLWLIPRTRREILITVFFSWWPGVWLWFHRPHSLTTVGRWMVLTTYFPMLAVVLWRGRQTPEKLDR